MSDTSQQFEYRITSTADNAGFTSSTAAAQQQAAGIKALNDQMGVIKVTQADVEAATRKHTEAGKLEEEQTRKGGEEAEKFNFKKHELLESTRSLINAYPELGEIMRAVFSPETIGIFGVLAGFELWQERIKTVQELLGATEMPDLGDRITQANSAAIAYEGIAKAVRDANTEFNDAGAAFERQEKAIQAALTATRALLTAQKEKAVSDLDLQRQAGQITGAEYNARKNTIEQGASDANVQAEIDARNASLAAKKKEADNLVKQANAATAAANAIKLPESDEQAQADIETQKRRAEELRKQADAARESAKKIRDTENAREEDYESGNIPGVIYQAGVQATQAGLGLNVNPEDVAKIGTQTAHDLEEQAKAVEAEAARQEEALKKRDDLRRQAEEAAKAATKAQDELAGEDDPNKVGSTAWQNQQAGQTQSVNDQTAATRQFGRDVESITQDINTARNLTGVNDPAAIKAAKLNFRDLMTALADAMEMIRELSDMGADVRTMRTELDKLQAQMHQIPRQGY